MKRILLLAAVLMFGIPGKGFSLQGGPTMPEYVKFEPADVTDIVNMSTGDFIYSIPLGDVPGPGGSFPITMSYHAGRGKDEEATWVGLGWTLNPGAINRMLRGFPDDIHNSATLSYVYAYERNTGWGVSAGAGWGPVGLNMTYDTDKGFGGAVSLGIQFGPARVGVDMGTNGVGISARAGVFEASMDKSGASIGVGTQGESGIAAQASIGVHSTWGGTISITAGVGLNYVPPPGYGRQTNLAGYSLSSANSNGGQVSIAGTGFSHISAGGAVNITTDQSNYGGTIPLPYGYWIRIGYSNYEQEMRISQASTVSMYGYMYQGGQAVKINSIAPLVSALGHVGAGGSGSGSSGSADYSNFIWANQGPSLENLDLADSDEKPVAGDLVNGGANPKSWYWMATPSYDVYTAAGPGLSGSFRPYAKNSTSYYQVLKALTTREVVKTTLTYLLRPGQTWDQQSAGVFPAVDPAAPLTDNDFYFNPDVPHTGYPSEDYYFCGDGHVPYDKVGTDRTAVRNHFNTSNSNSASNDDCSPYAFLKSNVRNENNRLVFSADDRERYRSTEHTNMRFGFIDELGEYDYYAFGDTVSLSYGGRQIIPLLEGDATGTGQQMGRLKGFKIVDVDGKQFFYEKPVYSLLQIDYSTDVRRGMPTFGLDKEERFSWQAQITPYATQWLLTEVRGADFIKISEDDMSLNYGYQVKLNYNDPVRYNWRAPYAKPYTPSNELPNMSLPDKKRYVGSMGQKELVYLKSIETATHRAEFNLNNPSSEERPDSREWKTEWFDDPNTNENPPLDVPVTMEFQAVSNVQVSPTNTEEWEPLRGVIPGDPPGPNRLHDHTIGYECSHVYLPFSPTQSQMDQLKSQGIELSGFNVAMSYYAYYYGSVVSAGADLEWVGAALHDPATGYRNHAVLDISPTVGAEERFGPFKITLDQPFHLNGRLRDVFAPADINRAGKLFLGPKSYWDVGGQKSEMDARISCSRSDDNCRMDNPSTTHYWGWSEYATEFAPVPPRMNVAPLYQNTQAHNQARYLKSLDLIHKGTEKKLRSFAFTYDNSLCPNTPNSFVQPAASATYPARTGFLLGKLTLRKVTETGYDLASGTASALPPYDFDYQGVFGLGALENPRFEEWCSKISVTQCVNGAPTDQPTFSGEFGNLSTMSFRVDAYGMFNPFGTIGNQKPTPNSSLGANAGLGVTWNLARITSPLGGDLRIKYERDYRKDYDFNWGNGHKGEMFISGAWGQGEFTTDASGDILLTPMRKPDMVDILSHGHRNKFFGGLDEARLIQRFTFADDPSAPTYAAGDSLFIVFKGYYEYEHCNICNIRYQHDFFAATAKVKSVNGGGALALDLRPAEFKTQGNIFDKFTRTSSDDRFKGGVVPAAVVFRINQRDKIDVPAGDIRVKSLTSCVFDCNTTVYKYEDGSAATRPDSVLSMTWINVNMFLSDLGDGRMHADTVEDKLGIGLGKNAMHTVGGEFDTPFLPASSVQYAKVTVANINPFACNEYNPEIAGCITNGKTVYRFHTADNPNADGHGILETTGEPIVRGSLTFEKLKYQDRSSIIGRMASVTSYGSQWNAQSSPPTTDFYMINKDSTAYQFGKGVPENWDSEKRFGAGADDYNLAQAEYLRYPIKVASQLKYQFAKKAPGNENVLTVPHMLATVINDSWDKLTGNVTSTYAVYKDGLDPTKTKERATLTKSMAELGRTAIASYPLAKEMGRRNMLTQPFSEILRVKESGASTAAMLSYKFSLWDATDHANAYRNGVIFRKGDLTPTFALPTPTEPGQLGAPENVYGSGYDLSKWTGTLVQQIDRHSHPVETRLSNGTLVSSFYSQDGFSQTGYVLNSPRRSSQSMVFNANPADIPNWKYENAAKYKNGNFLLQRPGGGSTPAVTLKLPLEQLGNYQITFRAKTRGANANLSVDFFSKYMAIDRFHVVPATFEGPQNDFTITSAWQNFTANLNATNAIYDGIYRGGRRLGNELRFFMDHPSDDGLSSDVLIDFVRVDFVGITPLIVPYGGWSLYTNASFLVSNKAAIYSSASGKTSVLQTPLDLGAINKDFYVVEFRARASQESVPLEIDFLSGVVEGDQKQILLGTTWKKYSVTLDRRVYGNSAQYAANYLRFFSDSYDNGEIEIDYARAYPQGALVNTVIHNVKGDATEFISENHVSTFFDYDPFGKLAGIRNDSGFVLTEQKLNYGKN